jgi:hypothetical protein
MGWRLKEGQALTAPGGMRYNREIGKAQEIGGLKGATNQHCQLVSLGTFLKVQNRPLASADDYAAWLATARSDDPRSRCPIDGNKLRRIVQMRRNGATWKEVGSAIGKGGTGAARWVNALPPELAV